MLQVVALWTNESTPSRAGGLELERVAANKCWDLGPTGACPARIECSCMGRWSVIHATDSYMICGRTAGCEYIFEVARTCKKLTLLVPARPGLRCASRGRSDRTTV